VGHKNEAPEGVEAVLADHTRERIRYRNKVDIPYRLCYESHHILEKVLMSERYKQSNVACGVCVDAYSTDTTFALRRDSVLADFFRFFSGTPSRVPGGD
jgi:hypothetical protein